jgi:hypothetical protein
MTNLGKKLFAAAKAAKAVARGDASPGRQTQVTPRSGCIFCALKMPTIDVRGVTHHEARDAGKRALVPCARLSAPRSRRQLAGRVVTGRRPFGRAHWRVQFFAVIVTTWAGWS